MWTRFFGRLAAVTITAIFAASLSATTSATDAFKETVTVFGSDQERKKIVDELFSRAPASVAKWPSPLKDFRIRTEAGNPDIGRYGMTRKENGKPKFHAGLDLLAEVGSDVKSPVAGALFSAAHSKTELGSYILIQTPRERKMHIIVFAHLKTIEKPILDAIEKKQSIPIKCGAKLGTSGLSGNADNTPPHLHIEVWEGKYDAKESQKLTRDPENFF